MLKNYIHTELLKSFSLDPTAGQSALLNELSDFIVSPADDKVFLIKGYAGTGKTTIVNALVQTLIHFKQQYVLLAPTGRAAKVLTSYTQKPAYTIHKKIYRQKSGKDGLGKFILDRNFHKNAFFIVDEASMIGDGNMEISQFGSGNLLEDLKKYISRGNQCRLILIGDTAQLPPVGLSISPALDPDYLRMMGYLPEVCELTDVMRQALDSGILYNATSLRNKIKNNEPEEPQFDITAYPDVERVNGSDLIEKIQDAYDKYGQNEVIVISRSNKRANKFNEGIRNQILWRENSISESDLLMVVRNNYYWLKPENDSDFIANGDIAVLRKIYKIREIYGYNYADVLLELPDYNDLSLEARIILETLSIEAPSLPMDQQKALFHTILEDYSDEENQKKRINKVIEDPYFNALQVKFAYAVTCHKAQGGQWKTVFIDPGYYKPEMMNVEYLRWLYTAFTRATEKLYLVNFPDSWFG